MTVQGNTEPSLVCLGFFSLGLNHPPSQGRRAGKEVLISYGKQSMEEEDLWSQKAQGITYPDGLQKSPVALVPISSFLSKVTRQKNTSFASYQNGNVVFSL